MDQFPDFDRKTIAKLRMKWAFFALLGAAFLIVSFIFLKAIWGPAPALRWLGLASLLFIYVLVSFWRGLLYNRRPDEAQLLPDLGPGNVVTLARGLLTALLVGFIFSPQPQGWLAWMPGVLYTMICIADFLDGYLARVTDQVTGLGERLDLSLDGLGVLIASVLVVQYGQAPRWFVLVGLARYLFLAGIWVRKQLGMAVFELPPSNFRRGIAGLMMDFMAVLLFPIFSPPASLVGASLFSIPFFARFLLDWQYVSGVISPLKVRLPQDWHKFLLQRLPLVLRGAILILFTFNLFALYNAETPIVLLLLLMIAVALIIVGAAGRTASAACFLLLGFEQVYLNPNWVVLALAAASLAILFLGTGEPSIWQPENRLMAHRHGERTDKSTAEPMVVNRLERLV